MKWFLGIRRMNQPQSDWQDRVDEHLTWMRDQHERGTILISGPSPDHMTGMYVMRAPSHQDAADVIASDPLAQDGLSTLEVIDWEVHQILGIGPFKLADVPHA